MPLRKTVAIYPILRMVCKKIKLSVRKMNRISISQPMVCIGTTGTQRDHKIHKCLDTEEEVRLHVNKFSSTSDNKQGWNKIFNVALYRP